MRQVYLKNELFVPCSPPKSELYDDDFYCVESTEAIVTLASSVSLIYIYCFCLPSDRLVISALTVTAARLFINN